MNRDIFRFVFEQLSKINSKPTCVNTRNKLRNNCFLVKMICIKAEEQNKFQIMILYVS